MSIAGCPDRVDLSECSGATKRQKDTANERSGLHPGIPKVRLTLPSNAAYRPPLTARSGARRLRSIYLMRSLESPLPDARATERAGNALASGLTPGRS